MVPLGTPNWALFLSILMTACVYDVLKRRVPNWLTVGGLAAGLGARAMEAELSEAAWGLAGAAVGVGLLFYPFLRHWIKGGDVKLLGMVGGWFGPMAVVEAALFGSVAGGILALIFLLRSPPEERRAMVANLRLSLYLKTIPDLEPRPRHRNPPYAVAIGCGALAVMVLHRLDLGLV